MNRADAGKLGGLKLKENNISKYTLQPSICQHCQAVLPYEKRHHKFCDRSCAAKSTTKARSNLKGCLHCDQPVYSPKKFCNLECSWAHKWDQQKLLIEADEPIPFRQIKKYLIERDGHKCSSCHQSEWMGEPIPLAGDHINGDPYLTVLSNIRMLCPNCHALTDTFCGKNMGNGRKER
jgi:hypothetical protein